MECAAQEEVVLESQVVGQNMTVQHWKGREGSFLLWFGNKPYLQ